jgi:phosphate starvation-inducible PhoH-like protein
MGRRATKRRQAGQFNADAYEEEKVRSLFSGGQLVAGRQGAHARPELYQERQTAIEGQAELMKAIDEHNLVMALGPAGTGKTYLAVAKGVEQLEKGEVGRIVLSRPAVEAGESIGFLPGAMEEKLAPYLRPLYDALADRLSPNA